MSAVGQGARRSAGRLGAMGGAGGGDRWTRRDRDPGPADEQEPRQDERQGGGGMTADQTDDAIGVTALAEMMDLMRDPEGLGQQQAAGKDEGRPGADQGGPASRGGG